MEQKAHAAPYEQIRDWSAVTAYYNMIQHSRVDRRVLKKRQCAGHVVRRSHHESARGRDCFAQIQANDWIILNYKNA
jgi:hypothetical protein